MAIERRFISKSLVKNNVYSIDADQPGACLIINNVIFENWDTRYGSQNDAERFRNIFKNDFRFTVCLKEDRTVEEMKRDIAEAVVKENIGQRSCFVLIILSHGLEGNICGNDSPNPYKPKKDEGNSATDKGNSTNDEGNSTNDGQTDKFLSYKKIIELLSNDECEALKRKPKICFIQACRGRKNSKLQSDGEVLLSEDYTIKRVKQRLPPTSDILFSFAAQDEYETIRTLGSAEVSGGIYARNLYETLTKDAQKHDLEKMLKTVEIKVREAVVIRKDEHEDELCLSTSVKQFGWSKYFYFYPIQDSEPNSAKNEDSKVKGDKDGEGNEIDVTKI